MKLLYNQGAAIDGFVIWIHGCRRDKHHDVRATDSTTDVRVIWIFDILGYAVSEKNYLKCQEFSLDI